MEPDSAENPEKPRKPRKVEVDGLDAALEKQANDRKKTQVQDPIADPIVDIVIEKVLWSISNQLLIRCTPTNSFSW